MYRHLEKAFLIGQIAFALLVIIMGASRSIICLMSGQLFLAICFAIMAYFAGYRLLLRSAIEDLRQFNAQNKAQ